jgi:hypothetical protein
MFISPTFPQPAVASMESIASSSSRSLQKVAPLKPPAVESHRGILRQRVPNRDQGKQIGTAPI